MGPNTGTASNYDVLIFCDFRENDWRANWRHGRFFLYGIYRARFNYDVSHYKFVRQCFIFLFSQKFQKNIEEILVAPVPTHVIIWGFVIGGVGRSILVGALVTIISLFLCHCTLFLADGHHDFIDDSDSFSLAGLLNGIFAQSYDDVSIVPTFVLQPLTYLGGVFYAISMLPPFWQAVSKVNPIVYMISGFRYGFLGVQDVPIGISMTILILFIVVLYGICWYLVETGRGLRS